MLVIPAIDLRDGKCVRLLRGDYDHETVYHEDPIEVAQRWAQLGAHVLHVVDLDGAKAGFPAQLETVARIVAAVDIPVQLGGGLRTDEHVAQALAHGVERIVIGTAAVESPSMLDALIAAHGAYRIVVGVDARDGLVATHGWLDTSSMPASDLIADVAIRGVERIVYTDIDRDGTLTSPNFDALREISGLGPAVIASGGVASREHLHQLARIDGVEAAIVGRALYTEDILLREGEWIIEPQAHQHRAESEPA